MKNLNLTFSIVFLIVASSSYHCAYASTFKHYTAVHNDASAKLTLNASLSDCYGGTWGLGPSPEINSGDTSMSAYMASPVTTATGISCRFFYTSALGNLDITFEENLFAQVYNVACLTTGSLACSLYTSNGDVPNAIPAFISASISQTS